MVDTLAPYTVRIERRERDGARWHTVVPDTVITDARPAQDVCDEIALLQTVADAREWRVRLWDGDEAAGRPAAEQLTTRAMGLGEEPG